MSLRILVKAQHGAVLFLFVLYEVQMIKSFLVLLVEKLRYKVRGLK